MSREIVGSSSWAMALRKQIANVAGRPSTVLITGPSGTGKELIARAVHTQSDRSEKPFIPIDCASVTGTLFASHMFGHVKGAFTGAISDTLGCFRAATGGTVFLDEIGDMELGLQAKLLRVLQERVVVPVGSHRELPVDIRLIAATNANLEAAVEDGRFRRDLFYRLAVVPIRTIPLSERPEDIPNDRRSCARTVGVSPACPAQVTIARSDGDAAFSQLAWQRPRARERIRECCLRFRINGHDLRRSLCAFGIRPVEGHDEQRARAGPVGRRRIGTPAANSGSGTSHLEIGTKR